MKLNRLASIIRDEGETIVIFDNARRIKNLDGKIELLGALQDERATAA